MRSGRLVETGEDTSLGTNDVFTCHEPWCVLRKLVVNLGHFQTQGPQLRAAEAFVGSDTSQKVRKSVAGRKPVAKGAGASLPRSVLDFPDATSEFKLRLYSN